MSIYFWSQTRICTLKTEQSGNDKKQGNRGRERESVHKRKLWNFNKGNYKKQNFCEACIILKRTKFSLTKSKEACPRLRRPRIRGKPAKRLPRKRRKNGALRAFANSPRLGAEGSGAEFLPTPGQAIKSARGMPWHQEPKKDAISCDKPRGAAHKPRSVDFRMGKPGTAIPYQRAPNQISVRGEPPELKHLSRARKRHQPRFRK